MIECPATFFHNAPPLGCAPRIFVVFFHKENVF